MGKRKTNALEEQHNDKLSLINHMEIMKCLRASRSDGKRKRRCYIVGPTGSGKSRCLDKMFT